MDQNQKEHDVNVFIGNSMLIDISNPELLKDVLKGNKTNVMNY